MECCIYVRSNDYIEWMNHTTICDKIFHIDNSEKRFVISGGDTNEIMKKIFCLGSSFMNYPTNVDITAGLANMIENNCSSTNMIKQYIIIIRFRNKNSFKNCKDWWKVYPVHPLETINYSEKVMLSDGFKLIFYSFNWSSYINLVFCLGRFHRDMIPFPSLNEIGFGFEIKSFNGNTNEKEKKINA